MNLNIDIHNFSLVNINFLDTKKNIIMDGNFTKIIYSNQWFTVNSIFICFPIEWTSIEKVANKYILRFNPYSTKNLPIVQDFARLEIRILEYFKTFFDLNVRISNSFSKQLYTGNMKIFKEYIGDFSSSFDSRRLFSFDNPSSEGFAPPSQGSCYALSPTTNLVGGFVGAPKEPTLESIRAHSVLKVEDLRSSDRRDSLAKPSLHSPPHLAELKALQNLHPPSIFPTEKSKDDLGNALLAKPSVVGFPKGILDKGSRKHSDGEAIDVFPPTTHFLQQKNFVIKVSGIWENYEEIGLTFKLMEQGTKFPL